MQCLNIFHMNFQNYYNLNLFLDELQKFNKITLNPKLINNLIKIKKNIIILT